jgi:hypothetical protein
MEVAVAVPLLLLAAAAVIEFAAILVVHGLVAGGIREASRAEIPGYIAEDVVREERIVRGINKRTFGLVETDDVNVTALVYPGFEQVGAAEPFVDSSPFNGAYDPGEEFADLNGNGEWDADMGIARPSQPGEVVVYTATVDWPVMTPVLDRLIGADGRVALSARFAVMDDSLETASGE